MRNVWRKIIASAVVLVSVIIIIATIYYKENFAEQTFEAIFYNLKNDRGTANYEVVIIGIKQCWWKVIALFTCLYLPLVIKKKFTINIKIKNKRKSLQIFPFNNKKYIIIVLILSILFSLTKIGLFQYISEQVHVSNIYEKKYIDSSQVKIEFPEKKRNLIYIFVESMEPTLISEDEGGGWEYNIIPELTTIAQENINFSNNDNVGGAISAYGTTWTIAGMVAQTAGIPLKINTTENNDNAGDVYFLPGVYTLGDILEQAGYNQEIMFGSDASFGGRKNYFEQHGNYKIFDLNTAIDEGKMKEADKVWWGFDDDDLYLWAKDEILDLASCDEPFNFIMLTADTHFVDGYLSEKAEEKYDNQYENVFAYSSKCVSEFIRWIQKQDFYENTTIVVVGDHIGMQTLFYKDHIKQKDYARTVYNAFINSAIPEANSKNRKFSTMDIFPTVLASMGVKIEGERLGLGTNLFSGKKTLIEEMGYEKFNEELSKKSNYYNKYLLKDDYLKY